MHPEEQRKAEAAVHGLFNTLHKESESSKREDRRKACPGQIYSLSTLYQPNRANNENKLRKSTDLIVDNCPEFTRSIKKVKDELLDDLPKYRLTFARPEQIVSLLPEHLRPKPLRTLVREELHRDCEDTKCKTHGDGCVVVNRLRGILFSQELADGIKRILKHQRYSATLPDDVQATIDGFQSTININCMKVLTTQLVYNETGQAIPESRRWPECFMDCKDDMNNLYIKHDANNERVNTRICQEINRLIDDCID